MTFFLAEKRAPTPTYLYIMGCGEFIKIGVAIDVATRRKVLQNACPYRIDILASVLMKDFDAARAEEKALHARFAEQRTYGEWFAIAPAAALQAISSIEPYVRPAPAPTSQPSVFVEADPDMIRMRRAFDALKF